MKKKLVFTFFIFSFSVFCFAQRVISPVAGNFCNKQPLVLDVSDGAECFYSLSGTDPLASGFAYDGPVLIDASGRINLKITAIRGDLKEEIEINYNVQEQNPFEEPSENFSFIKNCVNSGVYSYENEKPLEIPSSFTYCFDDDRIFLKGQKLVLDTENCLSRYLPCLVSDGKNEWRFVIFISGNQIGTLSKYSIPFEFKDWNSFCFTGEKLIWQLDDGDWSASKLPVNIDRSAKHTLRWQSVAFEVGNPVQSFVIPAEPEIIVNEKIDSAVNFSIDGDLRYRMEIVSTGVKNQPEKINGLFTSATFDTFEGDSISGTAVFAFYADGVFLGTKEKEFAIDKKPPRSPEFNANTKKFYSRNPVELSIKTEEGAEIFYAVSKPLKISETLASSALSADSPEFLEVKADKFEKYSDSFTIGSTDGTVVFYKVRAFAKDKKGNVSNCSEFSVVIDEDNYYLDSSEVAGSLENEVDEDCDGTAENPFRSFEQALKVLNSRRFTRFYVNGTFKLPSGETVISSNCMFLAQKNSQIIVPSDANIVVRNASFEADNLLFRKNRESNCVSNSKFFVLENSTALFKTSEFAGIFEENGIGFDCKNSVVEFNGCGLTMQSDSYVCALSGLDSKIAVKNSRVSAVSQTAVNFSLNGGQFDLTDCSCRVTAHLGRIAELCAVNASLSKNSYIGSFEKKVRGIVPVWSDRDSKILQDIENSSSGF